MKIRFGTAGVRGLTNTEISPEVCYKVSKALAEYFGEGAEVAIGYDTRPGAEDLAAVCSGTMMDYGLTVLNYGIVPSPTLSGIISEKGLAGGLMVTGSHLTYDRIGLIPLDTDGSIPPGRETRKIAEVANSITPPEEIPGSLAEPDTEGILTYFVLAKKLVDANLSGIRIALDPAGGTGSGLISMLLQEMGAEVVTIWDKFSDTAPRRMEPRIDSVPEMVEMIKAEGADFGAAFDSDCDRVLFVDEKGKPLSEDLAAVLFAMHIYSSEGGVVTTPINSSGLIKNVWKGEVVDCIIGPPEISESIRVHNAVFAYEESGKYFFPPKVMWADGIIATAMLAKVLKMTGKPLSELTCEFPPHVQIKNNVKGTWEIMPGIIEKVKAGFQPEGAVLNDIDGLKYVFDDGSWLLIRPSGTEPLLRVYVDAPSREMADALSELGLATVKKIMEYE